MRKRHRARRAPGAFDKLNDHGRLTNSEIKPASYSPPVYFRPSYKNPRYWVFMLVSLGIILLLISTNTLSFKTFSFLIADEDKEIRQYYYEKKNDINWLLNYVTEREGKLAGLGIDKEGILLKLRSENYEEVRGDQATMLRHRNSTDFHSKEEAEIINGELKTDTYGYHRLYSDFWSYDLRATRLRDINTSFINYLQTDYQEFDRLLSIISKEHYKVRSTKDVARIRFLFHSRHYEIAMPVKSPNQHQSSMILLDSGIYLIKRNRFSDLTEK